jgi:hypothetical protein
LHSCRCIFFCIDLCFYILFCEVEVVQSLNLFLIQMSLKFIKGFENG